MTCGDFRAFDKLNNKYTSTVSDYDRISFTRMRMMIKAVDTYISNPRISDRRLSRQP
jgi:hypothetical protein